MGRALRSVPWVLALAGALASCSGGVQTDAGADAYMRVAGAQFFRGPMPDGSPAGPGVAQISLVSNNIWAGLSDDPIGGALDPTASAAAIGLRGDVGYWVVTAGVPSIATPDDPSFAATLVFSQGIVLGSYTLVVRAIDPSGTFGPPSTQILIAEPSPTNPPPTGHLVVTLTWDSESNLDLHVVDPGGAEIYWAQQSSMPPQSFGAVDGGSYGYVDYDSNASCVIDGLRREDALWPNRPPPGTYTVRVDAASLCGQPDARWTVKAVLEGRQIAVASGIALDPNTWGNHGLGAGVLALQFAVP
jgi:hypothetical protein